MVQLGQNLVPGHNSLNCSTVVDDVLHLVSTLEIEGFWPLQTVQVPFSCVRQLGTGKKGFSMHLSLFSVA